MEEMEKLIAEVLSYCPWGEVGPGTARQIAKALTEAGYSRPEKTADEMFRAVGLERCQSPDWEVAYYRDKDDCKIVVDKHNAHCYFHGHTIAMPRDVVLACAQLIREMAEE